MMGYNALAGDILYSRDRTSSRVVILCCGSGHFVRLDDGSRHFSLSLTFSPEWGRMTIACEETLSLFARFESEPRD